MNIDLNKVIVTTNKFEELRQSMDRHYYSKVGVSSSISQDEVKVMAVRDTLDSLLKLLSDCVKPYEV